MLSNDGSSYSKAVTSGIVEAEGWFVIGSENRPTLPFTQTFHKSSRSEPKRGVVPGQGFLCVEHWCMWRAMILNSWKIEGIPDCKIQKKNHCASNTLKLAVLWKVIRNKALHIGTFEKLWKGLRIVFSILHAPMIEIRRKYEGKVSGKVVLQLIQEGWSLSLTSHSPLSHISFSIVSLTWRTRPTTGCWARSTSLWVHWNLFWQLLRDGNLHGLGMSHATTASPKPSFRSPLRVVEAVVGRGNAGWARTAHNGLM